MYKRHGYSYGLSDLVRRAMGKKKMDVMEQEIQYFIHGKEDENGNIEIQGCVRNGVPEDIAETFIPLGAKVHKDVSVVTGVLKIAFLLGLLGTNMNTIPMMLAILGVAFINGAVMGAIPGGGFMSEMLIVSAFGIDPALLPIIVVIGTILDAPATLLNSTENTVCAMLVARLVEGKDWLKNKINN